MKTVASLVPLLAALSLSTAAHSQQEAAAAAPVVDDATRATARELANGASDAYRAADYAKAYDGFNRAFRLVGVPALGVWSARSLEKLGRMVEASERYRDVIKLQLPEGAAPSFRESQKDAERELAELLPRIPSLLLAIEVKEGDGTLASIDGRPISSALIGVKQKLDPGVHHLRAERNGEVLEYDVSLGEREAKEVELRFDSPQSGAKVTEKSANAPPPAPVAPPQESGLTTMQTAGLVTLGGGVVFLAAGTVLTFVALEKQSALEKSCPTGACPSASAAELDSFNTLAPLSTAGLIAGGVLASAGFGLYLFGGRQGDSSSALIFTGPNQVGIRGGF